MTKFTKIFFILIFLIIINYQLSTINFVSAVEIPIGPVEGEGFWQTIPKDIAAAGAIFSKLASTILAILTIVAGLLVFLQLVTGALGWITSGGDKAGNEKARSQITNAVIGLVIIIAAWSIIYLIGGILGLDILNPQKLLPKLSPTYVAPTTSEPKYCTKTGFIWDPTTMSCTCDASKGYSWSTTQSTCIIK